jgi:Rrf2 family transcriptional regulator, cysteine metabolism repressor
VPLLSRKVDYALLILSYLHRHAEGGSAREIAARFELGRPFVANILKLLCHNGFVDSYRGVKGGYVLRRPASEIALTELMEGLDDPFTLTECTRSEPDAALCGLSHHCPVRGAIGALHNRLRGMLATVTLADLFGPVEESVGMQLGILVPHLEHHLATS